MRNRACGGLDLRVALEPGCQGASQMRPLQTVACHTIRGGAQQTQIVDCLREYRSHGARRGQGRCQFLPGKDRQGRVCNIEGGARFQAWQKVVDDPVLTGIHNKSHAGFSRGR